MSGPERSNRPERPQKSIIITGNSGSRRTGRIRRRLRQANRPERYSGPTPPPHAAPAASARPRSPRNAPYLLFDIAEPAELTVVVAPVVVDLDEQLKENLLAQKLFQLLAGLRSDPFQALAPMTDHDAFLALSRHVDRGRYAVDRRLLLILLDRYLDRIGNLLLIVQEYLLADDLRSEEAQRLVRQRTFG